MKKVWILFLAMGLIASCKNVKESKEYKELQAQRDSLLMQSSAADAEITEMMNVINEVETNFEKIRQAEKYIATQSAQKGEMSKDTQTRVNDNFKMITEILQKNKQQLDALNRKYKESNTQVSVLKKTIERLNKEMQESSERMVQLQEELAQKDEEIQRLSGDVKALVVETQAQSATIQAQDKSLHTAYFVFGTMHELKQHKILSSGFLKSTKVMTETFNKSYFTKIDIRETQQIPLYDKKAKVWSTHPEGTYEFIKGSDGNLVFNITDTQRFWSLTKYLIIEVY